MGFKSVLSAIGADVKKVFDWISSPAGQQLIATGEGVAVAVYPPAAGIVAIGNAILTEAIKVEALAAGAGAQSGTGAQKLAAVSSAVTPEILAYAQQHGLGQPTATEIQTAVSSIVSFLNAFPAAK